MYLHFLLIILSNDEQKYICRYSFTVDKMGDISGNHLSHMIFPLSTIKY